MRIGGKIMVLASLGLPIGCRSTPVQGPNLEMCVQFGNDTPNTTTMLVETVQQLKEEVAKLKDDNEQMLRDQENIIKSLTNKKK